MTKLSQLCECPGLPEYIEILLPWNIEKASHFCNEAGIIIHVLNATYTASTYVSLLKFTEITVTSIILRDGFTGGGGGGGGCAPLALARGGAGGVLFFMIKQKNNIRDKMRYCTEYTCTTWRLFCQIVRILLLLYVDGRADG